jgi:hypothetical protein
MTATRRNDRASLDLYMNKIVGDEPLMVRTRDISETGLFMYKLLEPEAPADFVGLEMQLPDSDEVIWAVGQIVREERRRDGEGFAVRFVRLADRDRQLIAEYVASTTGRTLTARVA